MSLFRGESPELGSTTTIGGLAPILYGQIAAFPAGTTINGELLPDLVVISVPLTAASTTQTIYSGFYGGAPLKVVIVNSVFDTPSESGTFNIEIAVDGTATGSGWSQLANPVALSGTPYTIVQTYPTTQSLAEYATRINLIIAGNMTGLVNGNVTVILKVAG